MNNYLLTVLFDNDLDEKTRVGFIDQIKKSFGSLTKEDLWGVRDLAYDINHKNKAYYAHFEFSSEPQTISPLDKMIKLNEQIVRYLLIRGKDTKKEQPKK